MASHSEVVVGSTDWVVRVDGADCRVKILEKVRKATGRGFEFRVQRLDSSGRASGRTLVRGSGALRKPGTPAKKFGGGSVTRKPKKSKPKSSYTSSSSLNRPQAAVSSSMTLPTLAHSPPAGLSSLRGRGAAASSQRPPALAAKSATYPCKEAEEIAKAMLKCSRQDQIRNVVSQILANHNNPYLNYIQKR